MRSSSRSMASPPAVMYAGSGVHSPSLEVSSAVVADEISASASPTADGQPLEARRAELVTIL